MKTLKLTLLCYILFINPTIAQSTFDLNDYFLPSLKISSLTTNFSQYGQKNRNQSKFGTNIRINYTNYFRNQKRNSNMAILFDTRPSFSKLKSNKAHKVFQLNNLLKINSTNRYYSFKNKKLFFENSLNTLIKYQRIKTTKGINEQNNLNYSINFELPIFVGWGRIENITEVWRAMRLLNNFDKLQLLTSKYNEQQLLGLANKMNTLRTTRYLDFRNGEMARFQAIDNYLTSTGLIKNHNTQYFTMLSDNWWYGVNETRLSGMAISLGILPSISKSKGENINEAIVYGNYATLKIEDHRAINQFWQLDFTTYFSLGLDYSSDRKDINSRSYTNIRTSYYPNSRTIISSQFTALIKDKYDLTLMHQVNIFYYLSPKTRIQVKTSLDSFRDYENPMIDKTSISLSYHFNINYYIH